MARTNFSSAGGCWVVGLVAATAAVYRLSAFGASLPTAFLADDFNHYYATAWLLGRGLNPYGISFAELPLPAPFIWNAYTPMATNPPVLALLTAPLAWAAPEIAWLGWELVVVCSLVMSVALIAYELRQRLSRVSIALLFLMLIASAPAARLIEHSQVQSLILLAVVGGWFMARRNRWLAAALLWSFAASVKLYAWPLLLVLLKKDRRVFMSGAAFTSAFLALPALVYGADIYAGFARHAMPLLQTAFYHLGHNMSVGRTAAQLFSAVGLSPEIWPTMHFLASVALPSLLAILVVLLFVVRRLDSLRELDCLVSVACAWAFLCSPTAWTNYAVALFFPGIVLFAYSGSRKVAALLVLSWALLSLVPLPGSALMPLAAETYYTLLRAGYAAVLVAMTVGAGRAAAAGERAVETAEAAAPTPAPAGLILPPEPALSPAYSSAQP